MRNHSTQKVVTPLVSRERQNKRCVQRRLGGGNPLNGISAACRKCPSLFTRPRPRPPPPGRHNYVSGPGRRPVVHWVVISVFQHVGTSAIAPLISIAVASQKWSVSPPPRRPSPLFSSDNSRSLSTARSPFRASVRSVGLVSTRSGGTRPTVNSQVLDRR